MHRVPVPCRSGFSRVVRWLCGREWPVLLLAIWEFSDRPYGLIAPPSGQGFWYVSYGEARWVPWK